MIDMNLLNTFIEVAKTGNLSIVAQRLFITQSALSQRVKTLEGQIGKSLFFRRKTGMELSKTGQELFAICKELTRDLTKVNNWIDIQKQYKGGIITISSISSVITHVLPDFLKDFLPKFDDLSVTIEQNVSSVIEEDVLSGRVDLGLISAKCQKPSLKAIRLFERHEMMMVCSPDYLAKRKTIDVKDLSNEKIIWYAAKRSRGLKRICQRLGIKYHKGIGDIRLPDMESCRLYALKGLGIAFLGKMTVFDDMKQGNLVEIPGFDLAPGMYLISRREEYEPPAISSFKSEFTKFCHELDKIWR